MKKSILNLNTVYIGAAIIALGSLFIVLASEWSGLWIKGIGYVANDAENYHNNAHPIEGEYTVEIDVSDLESNEGKVLYDDGEERQIYVSNVTIQNESDYEVYFRSRGTFSLGGATLVSGIAHTQNNNDFVSKFQAEANATYRDYHYKLRPSGYTSLKYRDGDEFGFYLNPPEKEIDIDLEEEQTVEVTVTNLYVNLWAEKR